MEAKLERDSAEKKRKCSWRELNKYLSLREIKVLHKNVNWKQLGRGNFKKYLLWPTTLSLIAVTFSILCWLFHCNSIVCEQTRRIWNLWNTNLPHFLAGNWISLLQMLFSTFYTWTGIKTRGFLSVFPLLFYGSLHLFFIGSFYPIAEANR